MEKCKVTVGVHNKLAHLQIQHTKICGYSPYIHALLAPMDRNTITATRPMDVRDVGCPHLPAIPQESLAKAVCAASKENKRVVGIARIGGFQRNGNIGSGIYTFPKEFVILSFDRNAVSARTDYEGNSIPYLVVKG